MTSASPVGVPTGSARPDLRRPRKGWYAVAIVLPAVALVLAIVYWVLAVQSFGDTVDGFHRFTAPGELVQAFDDSFVHIYAEPDEVVSSAASDPPSVPQVEVFAPDGSPATMVPYLTLPSLNGGWTYDIAGHRGVGVTSFFVEQPGAYRVVATGGDGMVLALGDGVGQEREKITFNAVGYAFLGLLAGGIAAGAIFMLRRRSAA